MSGKNIDHRALCENLMVHSNGLHGLFQAVRALALVRSLVDEPLDLDEKLHELDLFLEKTAQGVFEIMAADELSSLMACEVVETNGPAGSA